MIEHLYVCNNCLQQNKDAVWASENEMTVCGECESKVLPIGSVETREIENAPESTQE